MKFVCMCMYKKDTYQTKVWSILIQTIEEGEEPFWKHWNLFILSVGCFCMEKNTHTEIGFATKKNTLWLCANEEKKQTGNVLPNLNPGKYKNIIYRHTYKTNCMTIYTTLYK